MKNKKNNKNNPLLIISTRIDTLVKKPKRGGTPAIDNKSTVRVKVKKLSKLNLFKVCKVNASFDLIADKIQYIFNKDMLYIVRYVMTTSITFKLYFISNIYRY